MFYYDQANLTLIDVFLRDLMQFPLAHPSDGLIDIVIQEIVRILALGDPKKITN